MEENGLEGEESQGDWSGLVGGDSLDEEEEEKKKGEGKL